MENERVKTTRIQICAWQALRRKVSEKSIYLYYNKAKTPGGGSVASSVFCGGGRNEAR